MGYNLADEGLFKVLVGTSSKNPVVIVANLTSVWDRLYNKIMG